MRAVQRIAGHCLLRADGGSVALVRASARSDLAGRWFLPGGGVGHGEHPREAAVRGLLQETGVAARVTGLHAVLAAVVDHPHRRERVHTLHVVYEAATVEPAGRGPVPTGPAVDAARFVPPAELAALPLMPFVARVLDVPARAAVGAAAPDPLPDAAPDPDQLLEPGVPPVQRAGAYAVCVQEVPPPGEPAAPAVPSVLLARFVGNGRWTLPGGGIDHGEDPEVAVRREVHEEAGLPLAEATLLHVDSIRFTGHAPDGRREDFHGVRVIYAGAVPTDRPPRVTEVDGTTDAVAWVPLRELGQRKVSALVTTALQHLR